MEKMGEPMLDHNKQIPFEQWRKTLLPAGATLQQVIRNLDESALQIVLVVSPDGLAQIVK